VISVGAGGAQRIHRLSADGQLVSPHVELPAGFIKFASADTAGNFYVAFATGGVQVYNPNFSLKIPAEIVGTKITDRTFFQAVTWMEIDNKNKLLYVADRSIGVVRVLDTTNAGKGVAVAPPGPGDLNVVIIVVAVLGGVFVALIAALFIALGVRKYKMKQERERLY
jgi:hypothetical protein